MGPSYSPPGPRCWPSQPEPWAARSPAEQPDLGWLAAGGRAIRSRGASAGRNGGVAGPGAILASSLAHHSVTTYLKMPSNELKVRASELQSKGRADLLKQLDELKTELASLRVAKISGGQGAKVMKM